MKNFPWEEIDHNRVDKWVYFLVVGDGILKLWDIRGTNPASAIKAHDSEVLSCDWTKYDQVRFVFLQIWVNVSTYIRWLAEITFGPNNNWGIGDSNL